MGPMVTPYGSRHGPDFSQLLSAFIFVAVTIVVVATLLVIAALSSHLLWRWIM